MRSPIAVGGHYPKYSQSPILRRLHVQELLKSQIVMNVRLAFEIALHSRCFRKISMLKTVRSNVGKLLPATVGLSGCTLKPAEI